MPIDTSQLLALSANLGKASLTVTLTAAKVVAKSANDLEAAAKQAAPVDTGNLRNSIGTDLRGLSATVGPTASYGPYLEYGTSRMPPQPYMTPAAERITPAFEKAIEQLAAKALGE